ncbi:MAG: hypothetical protein GY944_08485, partial [bacterium]|nr:hypothetical protein [bacterium]
MKTIATVLAVAFLATLVGCSDEGAREEAPKISDMAAERDRVAKDIKNRKGQKPKKVAKKTEKKGEKSGTVDTALGPVEIDYVYDARDRRDPFRSAFWAQPVREQPRGPLEHYELGQLAVTAIVWE